jgi:sterol desaturase/sphingolipid hydroxylase (fatty acid hydroxylase superfamily)
MASPSEGSRDLTVLAVPGYFATMGLEYLWIRRHAAQRGPTGGDYERRDTLASLSMGVGSLLAPLVVPKVLRSVTPGRGRYGKLLVGTAAAAVAFTTVADVVNRRFDRLDTLDALDPPEPATDTPPISRADRRRRSVRRWARRVSAAGGVASVATGGVAVTTAWASRTGPEALWRRRVGRDRGTGPLALAAAIAGWDLIYYFNHRFMHESRYMWAVHVVHHSSEHYNLSTALRQPVADALGTQIPYGTLCLLGIRPSLVETARGVNLIYQYWIHTETIDRLGPAETLFNTPSHHRVHHGSNRQYLDRNHGSMLIVWDRLFGTFEPEGERVVYGLTKNINTFDPLRIAAHEHAEMLRDVARSTTWRDRLSFVLRGPGWATRRREEIDAADAAQAGGPGGPPEAIMARNSSVVLTWGNGASGTGSPSRSQIGSQPSPGDQSISRPAGTEARTSAL